MPFSDTLLAYNEYLRPIQGTGSYAPRCGRICRPEPGEAQALLSMYLQDLRTRMTAVFVNWDNKAQAIIENEYSSADNIPNPTVPNAVLFNGIKKPTKIPGDLPKYLPPDLPDCPRANP